MLERLKQIASQKTHAGLAVTLAVCSSSSHFSLTNALFSTIFSCLRSLRVRPNRFALARDRFTSSRVSRFPAHLVAASILCIAPAQRVRLEPRVPLSRFFVLASLSRYFITSSHSR
jgi:hypothetical protein